MFQRKNERFYHSRRSHPLRNLCLSLLIFLCVCGLFFGGISHLSAQAKQEQKNSLENALWRGVSQYYALWYTRTTPFDGDVKVYEKEAWKKAQILPMVEDACMSTQFSHIFAGGYSAGYYSY